MAAQKATKLKGVSASPLYTSRIIKAGAWLDDTKTLLSHWDVTASVPENLDRIRRENVLGKASRSRVEDILAILRQRYLTEAEVTKDLGPKLNRNAENVMTALRDFAPPSYSLALPSCTPADSVGRDFHLTPRHRTLELRR